MFTQDRARARVDDPETSWEAANGVPVTEVQGRVLDILDARQTDYPLGLTDEQIETEYRSMFGHDATEQSLRSRRAELVRKDLVVFTGFYGTNVRNRRCRRWALKGSEDES